MARQARFFATSPYRKSVVDAAKDAVKKVDRTVADVAVKGIEKGGMFPLPMLQIPSDGHSKPHILAIANFIKDLPILIILSQYLFAHRHRSRDK